MSLLFGRKAAPGPGVFSDPDALTRGWRFDSPGRESTGDGFDAYVQKALLRSGPVAACIAARMYVFSEATFQFRGRKNGRPTEPFGTPALQLLEKPGPSTSTGDVLARMEQDGQIAGNAFNTHADDLGRVGRAARNGPGARIVRLRPSWMTAIIGSHSGDLDDPDAKVVAWEYRGRGPSGTRGEPLLLLPSEVSHYAPLPDPTTRFTGMSWMTPVIEEIEADKAATRHKKKFFDRGASPKTTVTLPATATPEQVDQFKALMRAQHEGVDTAYKTLYLTAGADVRVIGTDLKQLDFKLTQGAGETRIASAARVHPVIAGLSEGLSGSSLNAGNFGSARRLFAEGTMAPLWRLAAAALENLVEIPQNARLWADTRDIAFLREDARDAADIQAVQATAVRTLIDAGYTPDAAVAFVMADNLGALRGAHSGLYSVQLQAAGATSNPPTPPPAGGDPA